MYGLISIFGLGGIAIIMSIARVIALGLSSATTAVAVWTALECSTGIIVACCPVLRVLFRRPSQTGSGSTRKSKTRQERRERQATEWMPLTDVGVAMAGKGRRLSMVPERDYRRKSEIDQHADVEIVSGKVNSQSSAATRDEDQITEEAGIQ